MIIPPSDDALNAAWNDLVAGRAGLSAGRDGIGSADAQFLQSMHGAASRTQPDAGFRDGLWAELAHRPATGAPPQAIVTVPRFRTEVGAMRPVPQVASSGRRWTSQIATIAAGLVIALVGYGALSLSGANPSGLDLGLTDVPNASAQGQGQEIATNPVVGTWAWLDDFSGGTGSLPIVSTLTLDAAGGVIATAVGDWTGHGTWSSSGDAYTVQFSVLFTQEALKRQGYDHSIPPDYGQTNYIPNLLVWKMTFTLSDDAKQWDNVSTWIGMGVQPTTTTLGSNDPQFFVVSDYPPDNELNDDPPLVRRLDAVIESAPTINAEDAGIESSRPSTTGELVASSAAIESPLPTPTGNPTERAAIYIQATTTAVTNHQGPPNTSGAVAGGTVPTPTQQVTVTPIPTNTYVPLPSPSPAPSLG
jgi:hypothetical protein